MFKLAGNLAFDWLTKLRVKGREFSSRSITVKRFHWKPSFAILTFESRINFVNYKNLNLVTLSRAKSGNNT